MKKILLLSIYPKEEPSVRYRYLQYNKMFRDMGVRINHKPFIGSWIYKRKNTDNLILKIIIFIGLAYYFIKRLVIIIIYPVSYKEAIIQKEILPFGTSFLENHLKKRGIRIIYDFDDAVFAYSKEHLTSWRIWWQDNDKVEKILKISDNIIAGNDFLADYARKFGKRITVIPTGVDLERYKQESKDNEKIIIGWIGTWSNLRYLQMIKKPLIELIGIGKWKLKIIGARNIQDLKIPGLEIEYKKWSIEDEVKDLLSIDIGVMPLRNSAWERGKCAFKIIQYFALGIPAVASPVGMNKDVIDSGENGYLASTDDEWREALERLIHDKNLRQKLGENGRNKVKNEYSTKVLFPKILDVIREK